MKILWLGDLYYSYNYLSDDIEKISKWIKKNNYSTILNLECTLYESDCKINKRGPNLYGSLYTIDVLKKLNVVGVCLANNHIMDYGDESLKKTIKLLKDNDIQFTGAGLNLQDAKKPIVIEYEGKKCAIYNYAWNVEEAVYATSDNGGCNPLELDNILNDLKVGNSKYDHCFVTFHWGFEYNRFPLPIDVELAHTVINNGASLIIGHHPHCIQPKEQYNDKNIYYSLGNFYFSDKRDDFLLKFNEKISNQCDYGLAVVTDFYGKVLSESLIYYDKNFNGSYITTNNINDILKNISNFNYRSFSYYNLVKKNKKNINPILNKNRKSVKIFFLYTFYFIKKIIKRIVKGGVK